MLLRYGNRLDIGILCRQDLDIRLSHGVLQLLNIFLEGIEFCLIDYSQLTPRLHLTVIASYGNTALGCLHAVGVEIPLVCHTAQVIPDAEALFQPLFGSLQMTDVLSPLVAKHLGGSTHLQLESLGKGGITQEVVPYSLKLISMACGFGANGSHFNEGTVTMIHTLIDNIQRQFTNMRLSIVLFLHIFNEFLSLRTATLVEPGIDSVLIRVHQFAHRHTKQQRLAVTLGNAKSAQQLRSYLARLVIGVHQMTGSNGVDAVVFCQQLFPVSFVLTALITPRIASPAFVPHPVTVELLEALAIGQFVSSVGPVPIGSLRIEMQTLRVVSTVHGVDRLSDESR